MEASQNPQDIHICAADPTIPSVEIRRKYSSDIYTYTRMSYILIRSDLMRKRVNASICTLK